VADVGQAADDADSAGDINMDDFLDGLGDDFDLSDIPVPGGGIKVPQAAPVEENKDADEESDDNPSGHYLGLQHVTLREKDDGTK